MVWLPERSVVFAGDVLFVRATPVAWTGPPAKIRAALSHLLSLRPEVIVPGHGPLAGPADVRDQIAYWQWLEATLERLARLGADPFEASRRCLESDEFLRSVFARWPDRERIFTSACTLHRHWGMMASTLPGILGTLDHFRRQGRIAYAFDTFC